METSTSRLRSALPGLLLCGALAVAMTGCGAGSSTNGSGSSASPLSGLSADQIAAKAIADLKTATSVRVSGSIKDSGQTIGMDMTLARGSGCEGTMSQSGSGSFQLVAIGKLVWVKPDKAFWKSAGADSDPAVMSVVSGKYLKVKATSDLGSLSAFCSPSELAGSFEKSATGLVKEASTTISGQRAVPIKDTSDASIAYISETAQPEFLRVSGGSQGSVTFSGYGDAIKIAAPPVSATLDGTKYGF